MFVLLVIGREVGGVAGYEDELDVVDGSGMERDAGTDKMSVQPEITVEAEKFRCSNSHTLDLVIINL